MATLAPLRVWVLLTRQLEAELPALTQVLNKQGAKHNVNFEVHSLRPDLESEWVYGLYRARDSGANAALLVPGALLHKTDCKVLGEAVEELAPSLPFVLLSSKQGGGMGAGAMHLQSVCTGTVCGMGRHSLHLGLQSAVMLARTRLQLPPGTPTPWDTVIGPLGQDLHGPSRLLQNIATAPTHTEPVQSDDSIRWPHARLPAAPTHPQTRGNIAHVHVDGGSGNGSGKVDGMGHGKNVGAAETDPGSDLNFFDEQYFGTLVGGAKDDNSPPWAKPGM